MTPISKCLPILVIVTIVGGCAIVPEYFYADPQTPLEDVAIIRGVSEGPSAWLAGITAVFQAQVTSIIDVSTGKVVAPNKLRRVGTPLHVLPGNYLIRVSCSGGGFVIAVDFPVIAQASWEYELKCAGSSAHNMKPTVRRVPNTRPRA
jgi:hypothetical protein